MNAKRESREAAVEDRRRQILDAALTVFSNKGYGEATVPEIAREAGVAVGTIYNYYQGKRDLLVSILDTYVITEPLRELWRNAGDGDDASVLTAIVLERLEFGFENLGRYLFLLSEVQRDPELRAQYAARVIGPFMQLPVRYMATRMKSGKFRPLDPNVVTRALAGMVIGFLILCRIENDTGPCWKMSREVMAGQLADLALCGLLSR